MRASVTYRKLIGSAFCTVFLLVASQAGAQTESPEGLSLDSPEPVQQCAQLVRECFSVEDKDRSNCFFSSARHPFCEGTSLGRLTYQRWIMSPYQNGLAQEAPGFLGPRLVDKECLANFDNQFMSKLLAAENEFEIDMFIGLESELQKCSREISQELTRP